MTKENKELRLLSHRFRKELFALLEKTKKGHIPSCFSSLEIVVSLFYGGILHFNPQNPHDPKRDRLFISKGHGAMVLYPILADLGFYPPEELSSFTQQDGLLRLYADHTIPGIEAVTGSLGHGLGIAAGHALATKLQGSLEKSFVIVGDGECYEGSVWETAMFAAHYELNNLIVIVDRNRQCILGETEDCVKLGPLHKKWEAFGFEVQVVDGHDFESLVPALKRCASTKSPCPQVIIAETIKGKGISFMENRADWHNKIPSAEQFKQALIDLENP